MFALREKLKQAFKDASKIVVEEFDSNTEAGVNLTDGRDLEYLKEFRVDKAKAGFTAWPQSINKDTLPTGLVIEPYKL